MSQFAGPAIDAVGNFAGAGLEGLGKGLDNLLFKIPSMVATGERADAATAYMGGLTRDRRDLAATDWAGYFEEDTGAKASWNRALEGMYAPSATQGMDVDVSERSVSGGDWANLDPSVKMSLESSFDIRDRGDATMRSFEEQRALGLAETRGTFDEAIALLTNTAANELSGEAEQYEMEFGDSGQSVQYQQDMAGGGKLYADRQREVRQAAAKARMQRRSHELNANANNAKAGLYAQKAATVGSQALSWQQLDPSLGVTASILQADATAVGAFIQDRAGTRKDKELLLKIGLTDQGVKREAYVMNKARNDEFFADARSDYLYQDQWRREGISAGLGFTGASDILSPWAQAAEATGTGISNFFANKAAQDAAKP